jgi:tetratricopeptide (TPR) repeat protein
MIRAYLVGILDADLGDTAAASRAAKAIPSLDAARAHPVLGETLAGAVAAEGSWAPGAVPSAVEPRIAEFYQWLIGSPFRAEARERYRRAQALAAAGQDTAAIRWYTSFETGAVDDVLYLAPSHLERARLYARLGRRALAAAHYRAFLALWRQCDPPLRPVVAQAQRELATVE